MPANLNRRRFLASTLAATVVGGLETILPFDARPAAAATGLSLIAERRTLEVRGKAASVFGLRQPDSTPGLVLDPGQRFAVDLLNRTGEATIVHWHGQTPPTLQDGVAETGSSILAAGGRQTYDFAPRPGTHWMHSHHGLQEQALLAAPLVVRTTDDLRQDVQEVIVLLHDFSFRDPAELLAQVTGGGMGMAGAPANVSGGQASAAVPMPGAAISSMAQPQTGMAGMAMGNAAMPGAAAKAGDRAPDLNDIEYDAYLANDRTLDDPLVVRTEHAGRVRLRLINGGASTAFWIDLGAATATVLAVDGNPVHPVTASRFPLAEAQRIDLLIAMPQAGVIPVLAQREGDRTRTGIILATPGAAVGRLAGIADQAAAPIDLSMEQRLVSTAPLAARRTDVTHRLMLTGTMMPYVWGINGRTWGDHLPLRVHKGQRVVLELHNPTAMAHPMHLHGHHFQVVGLNGRSLQGAMRDTVLVPAHGMVAVAFDANNPGRWLFHCHNLLHMATGMMTEIAYAKTA